MRFDPSTGLRSVRVSQNTLGSTVRVNQCVVCLLMSLMSRLYGAGSCRHRFIGVCSKLVNQLSSTIRW